MDMQVVMLHCLARLFAEQVVVDEGLGGLRSEFHHHACRCVSIHVRVFAGDIIVLDVHDIEEHVACLRLTSHGTLMTVGNIFLCHVLAARLHQFHFHGVLDLFYGHLTLAALCDMVGNLVQEAFVFAFVRVDHGLTDGSHNFLFIEAHYASVALYNCLDHILLKFLV